MNPFSNYTTEELQAISLCLKAELKTREDIPSRTKAGAYAVDFILNRQLYVADIHVSQSRSQKRKGKNVAMTAQGFNGTGDAHITNAGKHFHGMR